MLVPDPKTAPDTLSSSADEPDIFVGSREQLFHLLTEASEIEHALMCSYLYAAFSLKKPEHDGFSRAEGEAVGRWRKIIMSVAIEEMGHLVIVSNLMAALGMRPNFDRPNFPVSSGYFPSGVCLKLTAFSLDTLDHFIYLERPLGENLEDAHGFETVPVGRTQAVQGLMPTAQDYTTVSHLYAAIRANLEALVRRVGEDSVFIGSAKAQMAGGVIDMPGVGVIASLSDALTALDLIIEQGEGAAEIHSDCHFERFTQIRREYHLMLRVNSRFTPAYPVADNPVMRQPEEGDDRTWVTHPEAAQLLDLGNATYNLLLRVLVQLYAIERDYHDQQRFMDLALALMHALAETVAELVRLPATGDDGQTAGLSFTTLRGLQPFATGASEFILIAERLGQLQSETSRLQILYPGLAALSHHLSEATKRFESRSNSATGL